MGWAISLTRQTTPSTQTPLGQRPSAEILTSPARLLKGRAKFSNSKDLMILHRPRISRRRRSNSNSISSRQDMLLKPRQSPYALDTKDTRNLVLFRS